MPVCRMHGARKPETIRYGKSHPNYKHGEDTQDAQAEHKRFRRRFEALKELMKAYDLD